MLNCFFLAHHYIVALVFVIEARKFSLSTAISSLFKIQCSVFSVVTSGFRPRSASLNSSKYLDGEAFWSSQVEVSNM
ncbi:hypothetical protein Y032_0006g3117 [Ancylostoma ceylanicum]|uniref:Secreted protein n=1 Tax=Ancylostoma ceylanicum TaxID=53326 RepID=A0A016VQ25_9BILA|nr:hypothetical protein Y032_0006g3117 [Ancylostoma ceylanicum]